MGVYRLPDTRQCQSRILKLQKRSKRFMASDRDCTRSCRLDWQSLVPNRRAPRSQFFEGRGA